MQVYEHKFLLYEKIGEGPHPCHWCGRPLVWRLGTHSDTLIGDHLDGDNQNNDPANLVPSCNGCNTIRARKFRPQIGTSELFVTMSDGKRTRADWCECTICGERFLASVSRIKRGTVKTCSRRCANAISLRNRWGYERPTEP